MENIAISVSENQLKNLLKGQSVQLKHDDVGNGMDISFGARNSSKILKAYNQGKGVRINFTKDEVKANQMLITGSCSRRFAFLVFGASAVPLMWSERVQSTVRVRVAAPGTASDSDELWYTCW